MYAELTVVVDGALDVEATFHDEAVLREAIAADLEDAESHGYPTDIYVAYHDHEFGIECECAQFELDHSPAFTAN